MRFRVPLKRLNQLKIYTNTKYYMVEHQNKMEFNYVGTKTNINNL